MKIFARLAVWPRSRDVVGTSNDHPAQRRRPLRQIKPLQSLPVEKKIHHDLIAPPRRPGRGQPTWAGRQLDLRLHVRAWSRRPDRVQSGRHELLDDVHIGCRQFGEGRSPRQTIRDEAQVMLYSASTGK
jgi:hypothetical protein